ANRATVLLAEIVAEITRAALVLHDHFVATFPAVDEAVQQGLARTGHTAGFVPVVFAVVVADHGEDSLIRGPVDVGRVLVADADLPLIHRQPPRHRPPRGTRLGHGARPAIDERT